MKSFLAPLVTTLPSSLASLKIVSSLSATAFLLLVSLETSSKLLDDFFDVIILVGDKKDALLSREFIIGYKGTVIDCCGHYNLLETAAIIKKSDFFVGNDSGLGHIASAVKTKSFTIFGVGEPHRYSPWGDNASWVQDKDYQINNIKPKIVANKIIEQLN